MLVVVFIRPTLSYVCEVWGFRKNNEIERIHLKFCKHVLNVKSSANNVGVYGKFGRFTCYIYF